MSWIRGAAPSLRLVKRHSREDKEWLTLENKLLSHACRIPMSWQCLDRFLEETPPADSTAGGCWKLWVHGVVLSRQPRRSGTRWSQWESFTSELSPRKGCQSFSPCTYQEFSCRVPYCCVVEMYGAMPKWAGRGIHRKVCKRKLNSAKSFSIGGWIHYRKSSESNCKWLIEFEWSW